VCPEEALCYPSCPLVSGRLGEGVCYYDFHKVTAESATPGTDFSPVLLTVMAAMR
jgi:hypothetical protein